MIICLMAASLLGCGGREGDNPRVDERRHYLISYQNFLAGDYTAAISTLNTFIADYSESPDLQEAHYYLGRSYYETGQWSLALEQFTLLLDQYAGGRFGDNARYWRGRAYHRQGLYVLARADYSVVLADFPLSNWADNALLQIGISYFEQKDYSRTREYLARVIIEYPGSGSIDDAHYYIGRSYHDQGLYAEALQEYQNLMEPGSLSTLADNAHYQIGKIYYAQGRYAQAIAQFDGLLTQAVSYIDYSAADEAYYYSIRSQHHLASMPGDYQAVRDAYDQFVITNPQHTLTDNAYYWRARSYFDELNYPAALGAMRSLLSMTLVDSSALDNAQYYIGRCLHEMARDPLNYPPAVYAEATYQQARDAYAVLLQSPYVAISDLADNAHFRIALSYYDEGNYSQSIQQLDALITPSSYPYVDNSALDEAWYYLGRNFHQQAGLTVLPADAGLLYQQARVAYQSLLDANATTSLYADNAHFQIAKTYYDQGDMGTTVQILSALVKPPSVLPYIDNNALDQSWYFLGRAYENLGMTNEAILAYQTLLTQFPLSFYAPSAQSHLDALLASVPP